MYKPSQFLVKTKNKKGDLIILNTLSGKTLRFKPSVGSRIESVLEGKVFDNNLSKQLYGLGILVDSDISSREIINDLVHKLANDMSWLSLTILPTEKCNFGCVYCDAHKSPVGKMSSEVTSDLIRFVENSIDSYRGLYIEWFGGEPLTEKKLISELSGEFQKICKNHKKIYSSGMTTNGYLLDLATAIEMISVNKISGYQISLDGLAATHNKQRPLANGMGSFDRVLSNLRGIKNGIKTRLVQFVVRANITHEMENTFLDYVQMLNEEFGSDKRFRFFWRNAWKPQDCSNQENYCSDSHYLKNVYSNIIDKEYKMKIYDHYSRYDANLCSLTYPNSVAIRANGDICKCSLYYDESKIGSLSKNEFQMKALKNNEWNNWDTSSIKESCYQCNIFPLCYGKSCPARRVFHGEIVCPAMKEECEPNLHILAIDLEYTHLSEEVN